MIIFICLKIESLAIGIESIGIRVEDVGTEDESTEANDGGEITGPYFDANIPSNVTAIVGKSAFLRCKVRNLGNKTVSSTELL